MNRSQIERQIAILETQLDNTSIKAPLRVTVAISEKLRALRAQLAASK